MGQSNIISRWNLNTLGYYEHNIYQSPSWVYTVSNIAIGRNSGEITVPIANTKNFDIISSSNLEYT
jgi:hypothetical protein